MRRFIAILISLSLISIACTACGGKKKNVGLDEDLSNIHPYIVNSPYAGVLKKCVTAAPYQSCTLNELPPLGMLSSPPDLDDIMGRVVVSHNWMGKRFKDVLEDMPDDLYYLFGALTAVVIDDDIRPSYYNPRTGAIYLDPGYLWLSETERSVINPKEDFRGEYIRRMAYQPVWRYTGGPKATKRTLQTIKLDMAQLLFHELAHANDIFPPATYASVDPSLRIEVVIDRLYDDFPSTQLLTHAPLQSTMMYHLAGILYRGNNASSTDRAITAEQVGAYFEPDGSNDDYNYSSQYEDVAMLFEEAMMKRHFNLDRDVGFVNATNSPYCNDYILGWGMRNRLGVEKVKQRARWVVAQLLPAESNYDEWFDSLPEARALPTGVGWCDSEKSLDVVMEKSFHTESEPELINPRHLLPAGHLLNMP
jgi:hypothetical protein